MQLHLTFRGSNVSLPIAYRSIVQGLIYHALQADSEYSTFVHDCGSISDKRSFKGFTFGPLIGAYRIQGKYICFDKEFSLEIRSIDRRMLELLSRALSAGTAVSLGKNTVEIVRSRMTDHHLLLPEAGIRLLSPMVAYITEADGSTRFFRPDESEYLRAVEQNARRKWEVFGTSDDFDLHIEPIGASKCRKEVTSFKQTYITAWYGEYRISGSPEVIDLLYQVGLGAKSSQGFGMFSLR